ncbi:MAG: hypothetical protein KF866_00555 [Phycisphaeraceae bacterium]|nr:hypothetical protein [Phycisphaeraceae bacterium]MCW5755165.1 hypothetical protein [Phycisphaeraceae bacterium]
MRRHPRIVSRAPHLPLPHGKVHAPSRGALPLHTLDWLILAIYLAAIVAAAVFLGRRAKDTGGFFLGARRMPAWAVVISIVATGQSAATFVGLPQASFDGDLTYLSTHLGEIIAAVLLAWFVIPLYYRLGIATPYELLERRLGSGARQGTSWAYLVGRIFSTGARVFIGAVPTSLVIFGNLNPSSIAISIWVLVALSTATTLVGGIRGVIWVDVVQAVVYIGAAVAMLCFLLARIPAPTGELLSALSAPAPDAPSKLRLISFSTDPAASFTLFTAVFCFSLLTIASHGADHDMVQRMLTCRSSRKAALSVLQGVLVRIPTVVLFLALGLLLHIYYLRPDLMGDAAPATPLITERGSERALTQFMLHEIPSGLTGLLIAGLFAAGLSSVNSSISAMSAAFVNDAYRKLRPARDDRHYLRVGRCAVLIAAALLGLFATLCIAWYDPTRQTLLDFALASMTFAYAGILGVFFTALCTKRGNARSALAALVVGFVVILLLQRPVFVWWTGLIPPLAATPDIPDDWRLGECTLAWPWHLPIGAACAAITCAIPRRSK